MTLVLAAGMLLGAASGAGAVDFKIKGEWLMGFGLGDGHLISKERALGASEKVATNAEDKFSALQRVRIQLDAEASENLSGTIYLEIGDTNWGKAEEGGALGADSTNIIKLKNAYLDWAVPGLDLRFRMGIQGVTLPNKAGGSMVLDDDIAGIVGSYKFNDNVSLTALWLRPVNDNYNGEGIPSNRTNYLDNIDVFALTLPLTFDGFEITPWVAFGMAGSRSFTNYRDDYSYTWNDYITSTYANGVEDSERRNFVGPTSKGYGNIFFAGLPMAITAFDPLNIEIDLNYGYGDALGRSWAVKHQNISTQQEITDLIDNPPARRGSTMRQGWVAKALVEYKMDWGVPGIFGWYASGDDGSPSNGSERMPGISPCGNFTSFLGDGPMGWAPNGRFYDQALSYAGTWGIGARVKDFTFMEDLKHTLSVAYWGGTNSPAMVKYMAQSSDWYLGTDSTFGPYLTTNDGLLEINLINNFQIYENLEMVLELGYIANFVDNSTWRHTNTGNNTSFEKQDAWKAQLVFAYTF
jgi:hypothetical protein